MTDQPAKPRKVRCPTCGADVVATLKRSEFGMTKYIPSVGDEVRLLIAVEAFRE